jgi:rubrerythrin
VAIFDAPEIVRIGIEKERKRRDFYRQTSKVFEDKKIKDLFARLADWEEEHIKRFTEIKKSIKATEATDSYPGEMGEYTKSLLDDTLYKEVSPSEFSKNITSPLVAIQYGITFEKDAILFFNELMPHSSDETKKAIKQLINEEKQHMVYLSELKEKVK